MHQQKIAQWLKLHALPLWSQQGVDRKEGGFYENLSLEGKALLGPKRCMVQARQLYSFRVAQEMGLIENSSAQNFLSSGAKFLMQKYSLESGAFVHAVDQHSKVHSAQSDLYAQAFALFALAQAFAIEPRKDIQQRALQLLAYLNRERRASHGGYTELRNGTVTYESNPHMHLFEAALAWMQMDKTPEWGQLAHEIFTLCRYKLVDAKTGLVAERFDKYWQPLLVERRFVWEPGHQYEWAWLLGCYEKFGGVSQYPLRKKLYSLSENQGLITERKAVMDEVWSDGTPNARSSRFWPQCERIKAAVQMAKDPQTQNPSLYAAAAHEGMHTLLHFFETALPGLWFDSWSESDTFVKQPAKASSLYHIVGAAKDYLSL